MKFIRKQPRLIGHLKRQEDAQRGFTLIETSIALVVMMVAALGAASLFAFAIKYGSGAYDRTLAIAVAQQRMETLRKGTFSEVVSATNSDFISSGRHFSVVTNVTGTNLKTITVTVTPAAGDSWVRNGVVIVSQRSALGTGAFYQ
jgi:prepilin-type N-terminal cleavage/methylation domain-containing protein